MRLMSFSREGHSRIGCPVESQIVDLSFASVVATQPMPSKVGHYQQPIQKYSTVDQRHSLLITPLSFAQSVQTSW